MKFDELDLNDDVLDALDAMRFDECTPVQEKAIPVILEGKDLIAVAQTGTGKTAAYLLPVIDRLSDGGYPEDAINCIVMAPTRELAQQIDQQMEGFAYFLPVSSVAVYGGNDGILFEQQKRGLTLGADVVIATPGRLLSHLKMGYVDLSKVSFFILDEADRMLDMGFYDDIMQIAKFLPEQRQTIMFSATMPDKIQQLAKHILNNPVEVKLSVSRPADKIVQGAFICHEAQKLGIIRSLFKAQKMERVIIFASSKLKVKEVARSLKQMHLNVGEMHSDLDQAQRDEVMYAFKAGRIAILVATDIVARGIDIDDIRLVINYDVPHDSEDYVHRIGRTARAGSEGEAITFVSEMDQRRFAQIEKFLGKSVNKLSLPQEVGEGPEYKGEKAENGRGRLRKGGEKKRSGGKTKQSKKRSADCPADIKQSVMTTEESTQAVQQHIEAVTEQGDSAVKQESSQKKRSHHRHRRRSSEKPQAEVVAPKESAPKEAASNETVNTAAKEGAEGEAKAAKKHRRNHRGGRTRRRGKVAGQAEGVDQTTAQPVSE